MRQFQSIVWSRKLTHQLWCRNSRRAILVLKEFRRWANSNAKVGRRPLNCKDWGIEDECEVNKWWNGYVLEWEQKLLKKMCHWLHLPKSTSCRIFSFFLLYQWVQHSQWSNTWIKVFKRKWVVNLRLWWWVRIFESNEWWFSHSVL